MNRKIFSVIVLICAITLSGCGFTESSELMTGARKFIENGEYDKAMTNLSKVLDEDESNSEARGMYYQAMKLKKAKKCHDRKDYEQEIKELQDLLNDNSGSAKIRSQAEEMLSKAQETLKNQKRATITRKENAKKSAEENKDNYRSRTTYNSGLYSQRKYDYGYKQEDDKESNNKSELSESYSSNTGNKFENNKKPSYSSGVIIQGQGGNTGHVGNGSSQVQTPQNLGNTGNRYQGQTHSQVQTKGVGN